MNRNEAHDLLVRLIRGIAPEVDLTEIDADAPIQEELDLDSIDFLNLVTALHDATGVDVPERDYPRLATVNAFTAYVAAATEASGARV